MRSGRSDQARRPEGSPVDASNGTLAGFPPGIEVRRATTEDRALLQRHFEELPPDDRRLRFFGASAPSTHLDRWLTLHERGGDTFIATTLGPEGRRRCVGEAGFAPRGDGTAEFALSVAVDARGGLGTALLELLRRTAAARGLRALHGDVLIRNAPMNHLLRRRGGVTVERDDTSSAAVIIATTDGVPPWPEIEPQRPRVLVEAHNGRWSGEERLRAAGYQVAVCPGPRSRPTGDPCPLLDGRRCDLVDGADLVVHDLAPEHAAHRRLAATLGTAEAPVPVVQRAPGESGVRATTVVSILREGTSA
jgi:RimJ/RimL family protein N-acetyltransferase